MKTTWFLLAGLFLVSFLVRFLPLGNDLIASNDNQLVTTALQIAGQSAHGDFSFFTRPTKYPLLFSYFLAVVGWGWYMLGWLVGWFNSAADFSRHILLYPDRLYSVMLFFFSVLSAGTMVVVFFVVRKLLAHTSAGERLAWLSALTISFSLLQVQFSHQPRPHIIGAFFLIACYYLLLRYFEQPTFSAALLVGLFAGFAAGSVQSGMIAILFIAAIPVHRALEAKKIRHPLRVREILLERNFLASVAVFLAVFFLAYPHLLFAPEQSFNAQQGIDLSLSGHIHPRFPFNGERFIPALKQLNLYEPIVAVVALLFAAVAIARPKLLYAAFWPLPRLLPLLIMAGFLLSVGMVSTASPRMFVPMVPFAVIALAVLLACHFVAKPQVEAVRVAAPVARSLRLVLAVWVALLVVSGVQTGRFLELLGNKTTKAQASQWIKDRVLGEETIAFCCEWFFSVFPTRDSVRRHQAVSPETVSAKDKLLLALDADLPGSKSILRYWQAVPATARLPEVIERERIRYFVFSLSAPQISEMEEYRFIKRTGRLVAVFDPRQQGSNQSVFDFPDDFRNPFTELWRVNAFGPPIEIYALPR